MSYEMTMQETFDTVANHLLTQNKRSVVYMGDDQRESCAYRTPDGLMCAVGCLIPDDKYTKDVEGVNVRGLADQDQEAQMIPKITDSDDEFHFLMAIQDIHDGINPIDWPHALTVFAQDFNLSTDVLS